MVEAFNIPLNFKLSAEAKRVMDDFKKPATQVSGKGPGGMSAGGVIKTINLTGVLFATTASRVDTSSVTTLLEQKQWLEKQLNGTQSARTFTSNYDSQTWDGSSFATTTILAGQITFEENAGDPERIPFSMALLVGS